VALTFCSSYLLTFLPSAASAVNKGVIGSWLSVQKPCESVKSASMNSGDVYEQAVVKTVAGFFRGNPTHLFGVTRFGASVVYVRAGSIHHNEVRCLSPQERSPAR
jgi:hypothetical protein